MKIEMVMDRKEVASALHQILRTGVELLQKEKLDSNDKDKIGVIRSMGATVGASVAMIQQETSQQKIALVAERMKQLGYDIPKQLTVESENSEQRQ